MSKNDAIETFKHNGLTVELHIDDDPMNPRENDNWSHIVHWHRRRTIGDEELSESMTQEELREKLTSEGEEVLALLPVYCYEHGGITISCGAYSCSFDSGQVGWAYITKSRAVEMLGEGYDWASTSLEEYERYIREEVKAFADYLEGRVFGFVIKGRDGEVLDSCWGFLGDLKYCREEAKAMADNTEDPAVQRAADELASRATYALMVVPS